jgi:hypothetical protein
VLHQPFHGMMFTAHGIMQNKVLSYRLAATALDVPRHSQFFFFENCHSQSFTVSLLLGEHVVINNLQQSHLSGALKTG